MNTAIKYFTGVLLLLLLFACPETPDTNPFDPECPKEKWTPANFKAVQSENKLDLTWEQDNMHISGFKIDRKVGTSDWSNVASLEKTVTSWSDSDLKGGEVHQYRLYAYAGDNISNTVPASITPIIKALVSILQASNLQPTSVTFNGSVNANGSLTTVSFLYKKKSSSDWISVDANIKTIEGKTVVSVYANISNLSPGEEYNFKIKAVNSSGEVLSAEQSFKTPDFDVSPPTREVSWQAGTTTFSVNSGIEWNVTKDASWITVVKTNNTTLTANYTENTEGSPRTGNITVTATGGIEKRVTVVQAAKPKLDVSPPSRDVTWQAGTTNFTVNANIDWNVTKDASWLTVTKTNNTTISITYTENTGTNSRTANIKVTGGGFEKTVTVIQGVKAPTELLISPVSREVTPVAGTTTFSVTSNVDWSIKSVSASWINATKTNNTTINVSYTANTTTSSRSATITISGGGNEKTVTVIQEKPETIILEVTPNTIEVNSAAGITSFTVNSNIDWSVEDDASWLTATKPGSTEISVSYQTNATTNSRTATITVSGGGKTITVKVIQAASVILDVTPSSMEVTPVAGTTTFSVNSNVTWSIKNVSASWLVATKSNNTTINVSYTANSTTSSRSATITVTGGGIDKTVTVIQKKPETVVLEVTPDSREVNSAAGITSFSVNSNIDWSVEDDASWLTATKPSSTGISVSYQTNATTISRTATITVSGGGKTITVKVIQAATIDKGTFVDVRDNNTYKWVKIGNQIWMADNLAYLPAVSPPTMGSDTVPFYYVYGYNGNKVNEAKATDNYKTYGVLYNWHAAVAACPSGWHLPTNADWSELENYLIANGYNYDNTTTGNKIAKSLSAETNWKTSSNTGAVGNILSDNNKSGFSGLPGGGRVNSGNFVNIDYHGGWWSSTDYSTDSKWHRLLINSGIEFYLTSHGKEGALSVRYVRDY